MSIVSSMILKLHVGLVIFLYILCSHEFISGYPFSYFYCADMWKKNHWEQVPVCSANSQLHRKKENYNIAQITDGGMLYIRLQKLTLQLTIDELCN